MDEAIFLSLTASLSGQLLELVKQSAASPDRDLLLKEIASRIERGLPHDDARIDPSAAEHGSRQTHHHAEVVSCSAEHGPRQTHHHADPEHGFYLKFLLCALAPSADPQHGPHPIVSSSAEHGPRQTDHHAAGADPEHGSHLELHDFYCAPAPRADPEHGPRLTDSPAAGVDPEHGPDLRAAGDALLLAAQYNYATKLKRILDRPECSALLHLTNAKSESLLHIAAKAGHLRVVKVLLDRSHNAGEEQTKRLVQMRSRGGNAALHEAVRSKNLRVVKRIADKGTEMISAANNEGRSPLYIAVEMGFVQGVRTMLDKDPAAYRQTGPGGRTLLHAAVSTSNLVVAEILLHKERAGVNDVAEIIPDQELAGVNDVAEIPLDQELAGVNDDEGLATVKDDKGQNSIHYATTCGSLQAVKLLLRKDRSAAYAVDSRKRLPIHLAAIHGREDMVREIFLKCPDSANFLDGMGRNILHMAVENERQGVVAFILQQSELRFLLNEKDDNGDSPMHLAVKKINIPLLYLICSRHGVDKGIMNNKGQTAIDIAESIKDPYMKLQKIRMIRALKYVGVPKGKDEEDQDQDVISSSTHDHPVISSSNNGRGAGHDQNRRGGRGIDNDPEETTSMRSLKSRANTLSLLAILIATVTFAAAFTMPGGYEQDGPNKGAPIWATRPAFKVFLIANTLAMTISVAVAILQIWASASDYRLLVFTVRFCQRLTIIAILAMIVAFVTGIYVVLAGRSKWLAIFICALGPGVFFFLLSPLTFFDLWSSMKWRDCINLELMELYGLDYASILSFNDLDGDYNVVVKSYKTTLAAWVLEVERVPFRATYWVTGTGSGVVSFLVRRVILLMQISLRRMMRSFLASR